MGIRTFLVAAGSVLMATALGGCGGSTAGPTKAAASPFFLYTHCGINEARIGNDYYLAEKRLSDGQGNPPPGWDNPFQRGTVTVTSPSTAVFSDSKHHYVTFRLRPEATGFLQIWSLTR